MEQFLEKGHWEYGSERVLVQQNPNIKSFLSELLFKEQPELIIEIGTSFAGLTIILSDIIKELDLDTHLISYDNAIRHYIPELALKYGFELKKGTVGQEETDNEIIDLIKNTGGKILLLCDGGSKVYEFNRFGPYLKPRDIIGAHDYADNIEDFRNRMKDKIWNWMEIEYAHIRKTVEENNLVDLNDNLTEKGKQVAWILKTKN